MSSRRAVRVGLRTSLALLVGSLAGLVTFLWPLLTNPPAGTAHQGDAPFVFVLVLPLLLAVLGAELTSGGLDVKALAMLGLMSGVGAALRPLGAGAAGVETVFFVLVLGGRAYGPGFGFVLGSTTLFASALFTAGVGPWLPFQMLAASWVGLGAGLLPRCRGRVELALLAAYGAAAAFLFGLLLNLWFWPYAIGTAAVGTEDAGLQFVPGDAVLENLHRFVLYTVATSSLGWDTGRAITTVVLTCGLGAPVLAALRRAERRAAFHPEVVFVPSAGSPPP